MEGRSRRHFLIGGLCAFAGTRGASANTYPDRPIRIVIPYQAGGVAETIMRLLSPKMEEILGQKLIEAKPGAAGNVGTLEVARATPDGYTVLLAAANNFVINQFLIKMPVDPLTALVPIANIGDVPLVLFSNGESKARTLNEFVELARANPGMLSYGSPSRGTVNHLLIERLKQTTATDIVHVPFRGIASCCPRLIGEPNPALAARPRRRWSSLAEWEGHYAGGRNRTPATHASGHPRP